MYILTYERFQPDAYTQLLNDRHSEDIIVMVPEQAS